MHPKPFCGRGLGFRGIGFGFGVEVVSVTREHDREIYPSIAVQAKPETRNLNPKP